MSALVDPRLIVTMMTLAAYIMMTLDTWSIVMVSNIMQNLIAMDTQLLVPVATITQIRDISLGHQMLVECHLLATWGHHLM